MADNNIERKRLFKEIEENWGKYKKLWDNAPIGYHILNKNGVIIKANKTEAKMLGYKVPEMIGRPIFDFIAPDERKEAKENIKRIMRGEKPGKIYSCAYQKKDGSKIYISSDRIIELDKNGKTMRLHSTLQDVTENKKLHDKLEWAKNHYEMVIDTISDGICVIDKDFKVISANKFFADQVNQPVNSLRGKNFEGLMAGYDKGKVKDFGCLICQEKGAIKNAFIDGQAKEEVCRAEDKRGQPRYYRVRAFPGKDRSGKIFQSVVTIRDVTDSMRAEKEIQSLSEFNKRILDNVPVSIMVLDVKGKIKAVNRYFKHFSSCGKPVGRFIQDFDFFKREKLVEPFRKLLADGRPFSKLDCRIVSKDRETKYINILAVPLFAGDGQADGAISMALDNTEAVEARLSLEKFNRSLEQKVLERTEELNKVNQRLSNILDLKTKFVADSSHELRTPLTIIQGNLDLAIMGAQSKNSVEGLEIFTSILDEVKHMSSILTDLSILTNADTGSEQIKYENVDLSHLAESAGRSLKILAEQKNIVFNCHIKSHKLIIKGDDEKLEKLLLNIVRNAIKYTNPGGWVKIRLEKDTYFARIIIEDSGIGIPEEDLPHIFERFYRVDKARSRHEGGSGLGLSIAKWIAEAHGGAIDAISELGKGSKFIISLPFDYKKRVNLQTLFK